MVAYLEAREIKNSLEGLINDYVSECLNGAELCSDFVELVKHNFLAKYVYFNKEKKSIEIGINESKGKKSYPTIKVYSYPIEDAAAWIGRKFKCGQQDLEFYGSIINNKTAVPSNRVVSI